MKTQFFFFFAFISIFLTLLFLVNVDFKINPEMFLGNILASKSWQFIIVGVCIFLFGKNIIDSLISLENKK